MKAIHVLPILLAGISLPAAANEGQSYSGISEKLPTGSTAISAQNLVVSYDFESITQDGLLRDFGPFTLHAQMGSAVMAEGQYGKGLRFSRKEDVIVLPDVAEMNLTGPVTVAAKLKIDTSNLHQHIFVCNDLFVLWLTTSNKYRFADTLGQGFTTSNAVAEVNSSEWHSVVAVLSAKQNEKLNADNIKIFVNGVQLKGSHQETWGATQLAENRACVIGGTRNGSQPHQDLQFEGVIDELQIFSRALSMDEVRAYSASPHTNK